LEVRVLSSALSSKGALVRHGLTNLPLGAPDLGLVGGGPATKLKAASRGSELMAMRMVSKTMNPGSNPGSPAS
jgi:hypothetical protein